MKQALIIGATGGIGSALAKRLGGDYALTLVGRDQTKLRELKGTTDAKVVPTDVSSELEVQALFDEIGELDLIVYTAGDIQPELLKTASAENWRRVMDANLTGVFFTLKYAEAKLNKDARIFVVGARPELVKYRGFGAYAAAKAGVASLVEIAAEEMKRKASLTLVLPKAVDSDFWDKVGKPPKGALKPDEVAQAIQESLQGEAEAELKVG